MIARTIAAFVVCLAVVFAGCAGVLDSAEDPQIPGLGEDAEGGFFINSNSTLVGYGFDQPSQYTYEITVAQSDFPRTGNQPARGQLTVDVREVAAGNVTLALRYELDGETYEVTLSGTQDKVASELLYLSETMTANVSSRMKAFMSQTSAAFVAAKNIHTTKFLSQSSEFAELQSEGKPVSFETGTDSYAGVTCSVTTASVGGTSVAESCLSTDLGLPAYVIFKDKSGTLTTRIKLVEYES